MGNRLMTSIGEEMLMRGYDVEHHCCSADNGSLDGIVIPKLNIACIEQAHPTWLILKTRGRSMKSFISVNFVIWRAWLLSG